MITIEDIIAANALYRPGPMDYIPDYIKGRKNPDKIVYDTPELEEILAPTYGTIVYQEQVMQILRKLAGYSYGRSDIVRRAMSKKKEKDILAERANFIYGNEELGVPGCINNGIKESAANTIFDKMVDFAKYAFNKSHAAVYSVTSYLTAWLKEYYPIYFFCANFNYAKDLNDLASKIQDAREFGIEIMPPDINKSKEDFDVVDGKIYFALSKIHGFGESSAAEIIEERNANGAFTDFKNFTIRCDVGTSVTKLIYAGAFDSLYTSITSRIALADEEFINSLTSTLKKIKEKKRFVAEGEKVLELVDLCSTVEDLNELISLSDIEAFKVTSKKLPTKEALLKRIDNAKATINELTQYLYSPEMEVYEFAEDDTDENKLELLDKEKKAIGIYMSGHPIDFYENPKEGTAIDSIVSDDTYVAGIISDVEPAIDKNGNKYIRFAVSDKTGEIPCIMFSKALDKYSAYMYNGAGLHLYGSIEVDEFNSDEDNTCYQMTVNYAEPMARKKHEWELVLNSISDYIKLFPAIKEHESENGSPLYIIFKNCADVSYEFGSVDDSIVTEGARKKA